MRLPRAELLLPLVILIAGVTLGISQFMAIFELTPPGGEPLREQTRLRPARLRAAPARDLQPGQHRDRGDPRVRESPPTPRAIFGVAALLLFLLIDLPDAGKLGDLEDRVFGLASVRTEPQMGFWLEAIGAVALALATGALATLKPEQLRAPVVWLSTDQRDPEAPGAAATRPRSPSTSRRSDAKEAKRAERATA